MGIKDIQTSEYELQEYLILIDKVPEKLNKIDIDIKKELLIDIDKRIFSILQLINNRLIACKNESFEYAASKSFQIFNYYDLENLKKLIEKNIENEISTNSTKIKNYKDEYWFIVGVWIATGEIETLLKKYKNPTQIGKNLYPNNWKTVKTYIGDSKRMDNKIKRNTNIFNDNDKIIKIYNHCLENDLNIVKEFNEFYNKIELE